MTISRSNYGDVELVDNTASEPSISERERMMDRCWRDICRGREEDRFEFETPRGHVGEDAFRSLKIQSKRAESNLCCVDPSRPVRGPRLIGLEFGISGEHDDIITDLTNRRTDVVVYGDQHMWLLTEPWSAEMTRERMTVGEEVMFECEYWWRVVELNGWRED